MRPWQATVLNLLPPSPATPAPTGIEVATDIEDQAGTVAFIDSR